MTGRVHDMILDPKLTGQLPEVVAEGVYYGMQTFDQHLLSHMQAGRITFEDAIRVATSPHDFKLMVAAASKPGGGLRAPAPEPGDEDAVPFEAAPQDPEQQAATPPPAAPAPSPAASHMSAPPPPSAPPPKF
jgi:twitching motility protein PilT